MAYAVFLKLDMKCHYGIGSNSCPKRATTASNHTQKNTVEKRRQFLYFRPLPQEQGSFLSIFMITPSCCYSGKIRKAPLDAYR